MPAADQRDRLAHRVLDVVLHAPLGLALSVCDVLPRPFRQCRHRVELARHVGKLAVGAGRSRLTRQWARRGTAEATHSSTPDPVPQPAAEDPPAGPAPSAESLPIRGYASLAAVHVVERLGSLRPDEVEQIRQFELAHRHRRAVLARIAQLQSVQQAAPAR